MRLLIPDICSHSGGIETVNRSVIPLLAERAEQVVWVLPAHRIADFADLASARLRIEPWLWPRRSWQHLLTAAGRRIFPGRFGADWGRLAYLARRHRITHCFYTWIPGEPFPELGLPTGALVLDLHWRSFAQSYTPERFRLLEQTIAAWAARADVLLPISQAVAGELAQLVPPPKARIAVVPLAAPALPEVIAQPIATDLLYYPASAGPHKNHRVLFEALVQLRRAGRALRLVLTGTATESLLGERPLADARLEATRCFYHSHKETLEGAIVALGRVPMAQVHSFYQRCSAVVLPSAYEGFGLPLVEALVHGAPVVCSDIAPFREQQQLYGAEQVRWVVPGDSDALAAEIAALLAAPPPRPTPSQIAERFGCWRWCDVADAYRRQLLGESS